MLLVSVSRSPQGRVVGCIDTSAGRKLYFAHFSWKYINYCANIYYCVTFDIFIYGWSLLTFHDIRVKSNIVIGVISSRLYIYSGTLGLKNIWPRVRFRTNVSFVLFLSTGICTVILPVQYSIGINYLSDHLFRNIIFRISYERVIPIT